MKRVRPYPVPLKSSHIRFVHSPGRAGQCQDIGNGLVISLMKSRSPLRTLLEGGFIRWNGQWNNGWWDQTQAFFGGPSNKLLDCFTIEFAAGIGPKRRHLFVQMAEDRAVLVPREMPAYTQEDAWHFKDSKVHMNRETIELKKVG